MTIKVYPGAKRPSHQVSLSDGVRTYGLRLADGPESLEEAPLTPSTVHFSGGGTKFGDWEPGMSHIEQRTWEGGRGNDSFVDDPTRFYDSKMAWTLTPGKLLPAPAWKFSNGYVSEVNQQLPGDMAWRQLYEDYEDIAEGFSHSGGWSGLDTVYLWVRRVGNPGTLTVKIQLDSSGAPGTVMDSDTLTASDVNENEMALAAFDLSGTGALVGTESWLGIYGNTSDDAANHWEIGVDIDGGNAWYHYQKSSWQAADFSIYYRVSSAVADRKFHLFEYQGALYAVDQQADGTSAKLYINGDRGKATSGGSTSLTDTDKSWTADEWIGAWVKITAGTGVGQSRQITDNTATALTVAAWDISPSTDSEYVICHTDIWQDISPASGDQFDAACTCVGMIDEQVNFGVYKKPALKMRWNAGASPPAHEFDDNTAGTPYDDVIVTTDETNGVQLYRVRNAIGTAVYIQRASKAAWLTDYTFGTQVAVGSNSLPITGVAFHDGKLIAFKPDGAYQINTDDTAKKIIGDIGFIKSENNGEAVLSHGLYLYFSWGGYAIQRMYDSSGNYDLTNIGPDQDAGLPDDRKGKCVAMIGTPPGIMAAIQSDGYSSVLVLPTDGFGWHEVFRGWASGVKIDNMYMQDSYRPRLWMSVGGELVYQDWPRHTFNPLKDSGITYYPEAHLVSSTIDMGVSRLPKLIKEISATVENLSSDVEVHLDYQVNEDVGTSNWLYAGVYQVNPADTLPVNLGEVYQVRFRLRLVTKDESIPPIVNATVLEGFARTPVKYQWNMRLKISSTQRDLSGISKDADPDEFMTWVKEAAVNSRRIYMRSIWEQMDGKYVVVEPPGLMRSFVNNVLGYWGGSVALSIREI